MASLFDSDKVFTASDLKDMVVPKIINISRQVFERVIKAAKDGSTASKSLIGTATSIRAKSLSISVPKYDLKIVEADVLDNFSIENMTLSDFYHDIEELYVLVDNIVSNIKLKLTDGISVYIVYVFRSDHENIVDPCEYQRFSPNDIYVRSDNIDEIKKIICRRCYINENILSPLEEKHLYNKVDFYIYIQW